MSGNWDGARCSSLYYLGCGDWIWFQKSFGLVQVTAMLIIVLYIG